MRILPWGLLSLGVCLTGCQGDVCAGQGSCVALEVVAEGSPSAVGPIDALELTVTQVGMPAVVREARPMGVARLPFVVALLPPASPLGSYDATIDVVARLETRTVGRSAQPFAIHLPHDGAHERATVALQATSPAPADLGVDGPRPDAAGTPRFVFVSDAVTGYSFATQDPDTNCMIQAYDPSSVVPHASGEKYRAILSRTSPGSQSPRDFLTLDGGARPIVLPGPQREQVATDATFFSPPHTAKINRVASGRLATDVFSSQCVWTAFDSSGMRNLVPFDCGDWMQAGLGDYGSIDAMDDGWADFDTRTCDGPCWVYCIQQ